MKDYVGCLSSIFICVVVVFFLFWFSFNALNDLTNFDSNTKLMNAVCYSGPIKVFDQNIYKWHGTGADYNLNKQHIILPEGCIYTPIEEDN